MDETGRTCESGVVASIYYVCITYAIKKMQHTQYIRHGASIAASLDLTASASESEKHSEKFSPVCFK